MTNMTATATLGRAVTAARKAAMATLVSKHADEFDALVRQNMISLGYVEQIITKTKWVLDGDVA